jgi:hypothetical protein
MNPPFTRATGRGGKEHGLEHSKIIENIWDGNGKGRNDL